MLMAIWELKIKGSASDYIAVRYDYYKKMVRII
jgi:hypothetical protein